MTVQTLLQILRALPKHLRNGQLIVAGPGGCYRIDMVDPIRDGEDLIVEISRDESLDLLMRARTRAGRE